MRTTSRAPQLRLATRDAVRRGFHFLCSAISDPTAFQENGFDYLFSLLTSLNSRDVVIRQQAREVGERLSKRWVAEHRTIPPDADADAITELVFGSLAAHKFGVNHSLKPVILAAAPKFNAKRYFWFDPRLEPPPTDVPKECKCGADNDRGDITCHSCGVILDTKSRYQVWLVALIRSYLGERYGVTLGARYSDVIKWLPQMRPYPTQTDTSDSDFRWSIYAITHIVYTLNDYNCYRLNRRWLPYEFEVLRNSLKFVIKMEDPEILGEVLDSLKAFRMSNSDPLMQRAIRYLLDCQNPDGSWGESDHENVYVWHHTTFAALNGLDEYSWGGIKPGFPRVAPFLAQLTGRTS